MFIHGPVIGNDKYFRCMICQLVKSPNSKTWVKVITGEHRNIVVATCRKTKCKIKAERGDFSDVSEGVHRGGVGGIFR